MTLGGISRHVSLRRWSRHGLLRRVCGRHGRPSVILYNHLLNVRVLRRSLRREIWRGIGSLTWWRLGLRRIWSLSVLAGGLRVVEGRIRCVGIVGLGYLTLNMLRREV